MREVSSIVEIRNRSDFDQMTRRSAVHRFARDRPVQRDERSIVPDGQREQVAVGDLARAMQTRAVDQLVVEHADVVWPEFMEVSCERCREALADELQRRCARIARLRHDPNAAILSNRAGCPATTRMRREPCRSRGVRHVIGVEQRYQDVDVEQCAQVESAASVRVVLAQTVDQIVRDHGATTR